MRFALLRLISTALLFLASGGAALAQAQAAKTFESALALGQTFVAVVVDDHNPALTGSEAYADWKAYFLDFEAKCAGRLAIHKMSPARAKRVQALDLAGERNATLFVRGDGHALIHRGLVLEPQIYDDGLEFLRSGRPSPEAAAYGLIEMDLKLNRRRSRE